MTGGRNRRRPQQSKRLRERRISIRAVQRDQVDIPKLSRALIALVQAEAETKARAEHEAAGHTHDGDDT
jgi:hypothetical protein